MSKAEERDVMTYDLGQTKAGLESHGPFTEYRISLDGYVVPGLEGRLEEETGLWHLMLDKRWGCVVPREYANGVVFLIANAQAIGAGYSCFGEHSLIGDPNRFKCKITEIATVPEIDSMEAVGGEQ